MTAKNPGGILFVLKGFEKIPSDTRSVVGTTAASGKTNGGMNHE
jgi:hypothetical protein